MQIRAHRTGPSTEQVRETKQHRLRPVYRNDILVESLISLLLSLPCFLSPSTCFSCRKDNRSGNGLCSGDLAECSQWRAKSAFQQAFPLPCLGWRETLPGRERLCPAGCLQLKVTCKERKPSMNSNLRATAEQRPQRFVLGQH